MSPEQVGGTQDDIDIRSDVYALGILAFELLTGKPPFDLSGVTLAQALRTLQDQEPPRLGAVVRSLRGDLEIIVHKALESDKERRYGSAAELGEDLKRYINDEPILARMPTIRYQLRLFTRRNKVVVASFVMVFLAIVAGLLVATQQARKAMNEARIANAINDFLNEDLLFFADPTSGADKDLTMREALDSAATRISGRFVGQPVVEAAIRLTIGTAYLHLSEFDTALEQLNVANQLFEDHGVPDSRRALATKDTCAQVLKSMGRYDEAKPIYEFVLEKRKRLLGSEHSETAQSMNNLAQLLWDAGQLDEAERLYRDAVASDNNSKRSDSPEALVRRKNLAGACVHLGKHEEAEKLFLETIECSTRIDGRDNLYTGQAIGALAKLYITQERWLDAEPLLRESLEIMHRRLGDEHSQTLVCMADLSVLCRELERFEESLELSQKAVEIFGRVHGEDHSYTLSAKFNHAVLLNQLGRPVDAISLLENVIEVSRRELPEGHWYLGVFLTRFGKFQTEAGATTEAIAALTKARKILTAALGPDHERTRKADELLNSLTGADH